MYSGRVRTSHLSGSPPVLQPLRYKSGIPESACNKLYDPSQFCIKPLVKPPKASSNLFKFSSNHIRFDIKSRRKFHRPRQFCVKPRECAPFQTWVETPISDVIAGLKSRVSQKFHGPPRGGVCAIGGRFTTLHTKFCCLLCGHHLHPQICLGACGAHLLGRGGC